MFQYDLFSVTAVKN